MEELEVPLPKVSERVPLFVMEQVPDVVVKMPLIVKFTPERAIDPLVVMLARVADVVSGFVVEIEAA